MVHISNTTQVIILLKHQYLLDSLYRSTQKHSLCCWNRQFLILKPYVMYIFFRIEYVSYRQGPYRIRIVSADGRIVLALDPTYLLSSTSCNLKLAYYFQAHISLYTDSSTYSTVALFLFSGFCYCSLNVSRYSFFQTECCELKNLKCFWLKTMNKYANLTHSES